MKSASSTPTPLPETPPNGRDRRSGLGPRRSRRVGRRLPRPRSRCGTPSSTAPPGCAELVDVLARVQARGRSRSNDPTGRSLTPCLHAGMTVVVISPNQVKNLRGRYGSAGNKDDRFDAYVLADTLRTDRARLRPLVPDTRRRRSRCAAPAAPAETSSPTASRWPTSCAPTCVTCSPAPSDCSPTSTARSAWRS